MQIAEYKESRTKYRYVRHHHIQYVLVWGLLRDYIRLETFSLGFFSWPGIAVRGVRSGKRHKQTLKTSAITVQHTVSRKEGKGHFLSSFSLYEFS